MYKKVRVGELKNGDLARREESLAKQRGVKLARV
jgi:hypothetical protein